MVSLRGSGQNETRTLDGTGMGDAAGMQEAAHDGGPGVSRVTSVVNQISAPFAVSGEVVQSADHLPHHSSPA
jgi:hypothetical protein